MKNSTKIALMGALLAVGVAQTNAAPVAKTNYDAAVTFTLTSYVPGVNKAGAVATKDIIAGLSGAAYNTTEYVYTAMSGTNTGTFTNTVPAGYTNATILTNYVVAKTLPAFTKTAKLIRRQVVSGTNVATSGIFVLDGTKPVVATDVSSWFNGGQSIASVEVKSGAKVTTYADQEIKVGGKVAYDVTGVFAKTSALSGKNGAMVQNSFKGTVSGTCTTSGTNSVTGVVTGTLSLTGGKLE